MDFLIKKFFEKHMFSLKGFNTKPFLISNSKATETLPSLWKLFYVSKNSQATKKAKKH